MGHKNFKKKENLGQICEPKKNVGSPNWHKSSGQLFQDPLIQNSLI